MVNNNTYFLNMRIIQLLSSCILWFTAFSYFLKAVRYDILRLSRLDVETPGGSTTDLNEKTGDRYLDHPVYSLPQSYPKAAFNTGCHVASTFMK